MPTDVGLTWESRGSEVLYLICERTMGGLEARARGRKGGRKPVMDEKKLALASAILKNREIPVREVCEAVGVSRSTLYRHLRPDGSAR